MSTSQLAHHPSTAGLAQGHVDLSNCCLAMGVWLCGAGLLGTARLVLMMSEQHTLFSHQIARACGRHQSLSNLASSDAPRAAYDSVLDAADRLLAAERAALAILEVAVTEISAVDRNLAIDLLRVLSGQRGLTRAITLFHNEARHHSPDFDRLESWALKNAQRFRALMSVRMGAHAQSRLSTTPAASGSTWSDT